MSEVAFSNVVLPVELISFKGRKIDSDIHLSWVTAMELNNSHFEIERSTGGIDFDNIGIVNGRGTSQSLTTYSFLDNTPLDGINYYRLKQIDFDNKFSYSNIISIDFQSGNSIVEVFPNPFAERITVKLKETKLKEINRIELLDHQGRLLRIVYSDEDSNENDLSFILSNLSNGTYALRIISSNGQSTFHQIIKTN